MYVESIDNGNSRRDYWGSQVDRPFKQSLNDIRDLKAITSRLKTLEEKSVASLCWVHLQVIPYSRDSEDENLTLANVRGKQARRQLRTPSHKRDRLLVSYCRLSIAITYEKYLVTGLFRL